VSECRVTDPLLLAMENPSVSLPARGCEEATCGTRADQRLSQTKGPDLFESCHRRQPFLFLLFRSAKEDRSHRKAAMHTEEGGEGAVDPSYLHGDVASQKIAATGTSIALVS